MERGQLKSIIEAMVFVAEEPITEKAMLIALDPDGVEKAEVREALAEIRTTWNENAQGGLQLVEVAGGYQFRTKETVAEWVKRLCASKPMKLSPAALETLAIVAYRQPIVRAEIEHVRGVDSGGVLKKLMERRLIRIVGKRDEPGQPLIYGTTNEFLELFNLANLKDLPPLADLKDLAERRVHSPDAAEGEAEDEGQSALFDEEDEEKTVALRDVEDDEEQTEIIARLEHDEEEDREALDNLEENLKHVRKLEKAMFPKPAPKPAEGSEGQDDAGESQQTQPAPAAAGEPGAEAAPEASEQQPAADAGDADEDAPQQADRAGQ